MVVFADTVPDTIYAFVPEQKYCCILSAIVTAHIASSVNQERGYVPYFPGVLIWIKHIIDNALGHSPESLDIALEEYAGVHAAVSGFDLL